MNRRTVLKGGFVAAITAHTTVSVAEIAPYCRATEMRDCLMRLDQLLREETGGQWTIVGAPITPTAKGVFSITEDGLHDPFGMLGEKLRFGKKITGEAVAA